MSDQTQEQPVTHAQVQAMASQAASEAVAAHMASAAPASDADHLTALQTGLADVQARVTQVETIVSAFAPLGEGIASMIPGVGTEVAAGIGVVPQLVAGFNALLAEVQAAFGGKVAGHLVPVATPAQPAD